MKKKIIGITCSTVGIILVSALLAFGIVQMTRQEKVIETGNVLGVSWYNETDTEFTISTAQQLYEFARLSSFYSFRDQTIRLGADIVLNEGDAADWKENVPANRWVPISGFEGTFDGQGHTISGLYAKAFSAPMAMFVETTYRCTIRDVRLVNSYFETQGYRGTASFVSNGGGKLSKLYSDAIIDCSGENAGGIASMVNVQSTFDECWYDGAIHITQRDCGGIVDETIGQRVTIKHSLFSGSIDSEYTLAGTRTGGIVGRVDQSAALVIEDCLSSGMITAANTVYTGAFLGATYAGVEITTHDSYALSDTYSLLIGQAGENATFNGKPLTMQSTELSGTNAYRWTTLDFDGHWAAQEDATPVLKYFAGEGLSLAGIEKAYDLSWYNSGSYNFVITNLKQLYGLYILSAGSNFSGVEFKLGADIVVNSGDAKKWDKEAPENPWFPISAFSGVFDGQGHTISGIYIDTANTYIGLFARVNASGSVKNINIKNSYFYNRNETNAFMGSIAGETYGNLENIYSNAILISKGDQVGGIVGRSNNTKEGAVNIRNCWFDGTLTMLTRGAEGSGSGAIDGGGIVGRLVQGDLNLEHCLNTGTISSSVTGAGVHLGGIIGSTRNAGTLNLTDTFNSGKINSEYTVCVGSVIGRTTGGADRIVNITDTYTTTESYQAAVSTNASNATINGGAIQLPEATLTGIGGFQWTTLNFNEYWAAVSDSTPVLKSYASKTISTAGYKKMVDFSWYTADAKEYALDTAEDLYGFALLSGANNYSGKVIKLGADIALDKTIPWITIGSSSKPFAGTFDGQGHTVSGVYLDTTENYAGFVSRTSATAVLKNFRLKDSYFNGTGATFIGSVVGELYGTIDTVYSNAVVTSDGQQLGGLAGRLNSQKENGVYTIATINNSWFDGELIHRGEAENLGGIAGAAIQGSAGITNCLVTGTLSSERTENQVFMGGILGHAGFSSTAEVNLEISNSLFAPRQAMSYQNSLASAIGAIIGGIKTEGKDAGPRIYTITKTYATDISLSNKKPIGMNTAKATMVASSVLSEEELQGVNGYFKLGSEWVAIKDRIPILQSFADLADPDAEFLDTAGLLAQDTSWYDKNKKDFVIRTSEELYGFMKLLSDGEIFEGQTVTLAADVALNEVQEGTIAAWENGDTPKNIWYPAGNGTVTTQFAGTFDGGGNTISGIYASGSTYIGMFGAIGTTGTVKNLRLTDSYFYSEGGYLGSIAGVCNGTIDTVYSNAVVVSKGGRIGGIAGIANEGTPNTNLKVANIRKAWFEGRVETTIAAKAETGGIVGLAARNEVNITDCLFSGVLSVENTTSDVRAGGILGDTNAAGTVNMKHCLSTGEMRVAALMASGMGTLVGIARSASGTVVINITESYAAKQYYQDDESQPFKTVGGIGSGASCPKGRGEEKSLDSIKGVEAKDVLTGFEFDSVWTTRNGKVPALKELLPAETNPVEAKVALEMQHSQVLTKIFDRKQLLSPKEAEK